MLTKTTRLRRLTIFLVILLVAVLGVFLWFVRNNSDTQISFDPPYPKVNTAGDPIVAVFEGRTPCHVERCERMKVGLVLYHNAETKAPTTYWLGLILVGTGNDWHITQGKWTYEQGVEGYPEAVVYELDSNTSQELRYYWQVNADILLPLDQNRNPKVGNAGWGYMLSRYSQPYGERIYE